MILHSVCIIFAINSEDKLKIIHIMKLLYRYIWLLFIILPFASCSNDDEPKDNPDQPGTKVERYLVSVSSTEEMTREQLLAKFDVESAYSILLPNRTIRSASLLYYTKDAEGNQIVASGIITYPKDGKTKGTVVGMHYTITTNDEAPSSKMYTIESALSFYGYTVICPDYIGYGSTASLPHPYLHAKLTGECTADLVFAAREYMDSLNISTDDSLYVVGYSEGGGAAVAFQKYAEENYPDKLPLRYVMAGGGPYDPVATTDTILAHNGSDYPASIPMAIIGLDYGDQLHLNFSKIFLEPLLSNYNKWINSKTYTSGEINTNLGGGALTNFLSPDFFTTEKNSDIKKLYVSLNANRLIDWTPKTPLLLVHGKNDKIVPYINAQEAYESFKARGCNVDLISVDKASHYDAAILFYLKVLNKLK